MIMMDLKEVQNTYFKPGRVEFIGIRPMRIAPLAMVAVIKAVENMGLQGDHYNNPGGNRQVTLIQAEHLVVVAALLEESKIQPEKLRRNIVVSGINLVSLKSKQFKIGEAVLECTRRLSSLYKNGKEPGPRRL